MVHDGDPRRTKRAPEVCWVRILGAEPGPPRLARQPSGEPSPARDTWVYVARLTNAPHGLQDIRQGEELRFLSSAEMPFPLHVTRRYLEERGSWLINPCNKCSWDEAMDPPSTMARSRFPDMPPDAEPVTFTAFCPQCDGFQVLTRANATAP